MRGGGRQKRPDLKIHLKNSNRGRVWESAGPPGTRWASSRLPANGHCSGACARRRNPARHNQLCRWEVTYWLGIKKKVIQNHRGKSKQSHLEKVYLLWAWSSWHVPLQLPPPSQWQPFPHVKSLSTQNSILGNWDISKARQFIVLGVQISHRITTQDFLSQRGQWWVLLNIYRQCSKNSDCFCSSVTQKATFYHLDIKVRDYSAPEGIQNEHYCSLLRKVWI